MPNDEVIEAIKQHQFHIYEVKTIEDGLTILTGMPTGELDVNKKYEDNNIYRKVTDKLSTYAWFTNEFKN